MYKNCCNVFYKNSIPTTNSKKCYNKKRTKKRCYIISNEKKTNYETKLNSEFPDNLKLAGVTCLHKSVRIF